MLKLRRLRPALGIALAVPALWLASLAIAPPADAYVYWTNSNGAAIGRAELDGSGANPSFISTLGFPEAVTVGPGHIYWTNATDAIGRADLDGTGIVHAFISGDEIDGVAVDATHIYWSNSGDDTIGRANIYGTGVQQAFISGLDVPGHLVVDSKYIYWANGGSKTIGRAKLNGTGVDQSFIEAEGSPAGVAIDAGHIYWVNAAIQGELGSIGRADIDGGDVDQYFTNSANAPSFGFPSGVAVDPGHLYWADFSYPSIVRSNIDGTAVNAQFIGTGLFTFPRGVAVDALPSPPEPPEPPEPPKTDVTAPQTRITKRPPNKTRRQRVRFKFTSSEPGSSFECKRDGRRYRSCTSPKKLRGLSEGKHRFKVRATDSAGNTDATPAKDRFKIKSKAQR